MPRGRRMPAAAKAWGRPQDRLTSGRYRARARWAAEATRQHAGSRPAGGLARQPGAERPAAGLPPPTADGPSHATWRGQHGTHAAETAGEVMGCSSTGGASQHAGSPRTTHGGERRDPVLPTASAMARSQRARSRRHRPLAQTPREAHPGLHHGQPPARHAHPSGARSPTPRASSPRTRMGSQARRPYLGLSPWTVLS
jgi:hypothetical protein